MRNQRQFLLADYCRVDFHMQKFNGKGKITELCEVDQLLLNCLAKIT